MFTFIMIGLNVIEIKSSFDILIKGQSTRCCHMLRLFCGTREQVKYHQSCYESCFVWLLGYLSWLIGLWYLASMPH